MANFNIKIIGLDGAIKSLDKMSISVDINMKKAITDSTELTRQNIARKAPVDIGTLKKSINKRVFGLKGIVGVGSESAKYGYVQEYGRVSKRMPPIAPIEVWAARHGMPGMGFVVARSIAQKGTKPQPFFEPGIEVSISGIVKIFERQAKRIIEI